MLPERPELHPDLPWSIDAHILESLRGRLAADPPLRSVLYADGAGGVVIVERRAILTQETLPGAPLLAVCLYADREGRGTSGYGAEQETVVELALLTNPPLTLTDHADHLRSRLVAQIRRVVRQDGGALYRGEDDDEPELAIAATTIDRVNFDEAGLPSGLVLTVLRVTYRSDINLLSQEVIP